MFTLWVAARCVCDRKTRRWEEVRARECVNVPIDACVCVRGRGNKPRYEPSHKSQNITQTQKSLISTEHMPENSKQKTDISRASRNTNPWESPTWKIWKSGMSAWQAGDSQSWRLRGVESHTSAESMGDEVMRGGIGTLPHILLLIDWPHTEDYR